MVQCEMAVAEQLIRRAAVAGKYRAAHADADAVLARSGLKRSLERDRYSARKPFDPGAGILSRNQEDELVAIHPRQSEVAEGLRSQHLGYRKDRKVAGGVTKHILNLVKVIDCERQHADFALFGPACVKRCTQACMKRVAIGQSCQRIVFGQKTNSLGFALSGRDVAQYRAILDAA